MNENMINLEFQKYNHFWLDSGLLGFYIIAELLQKEQNTVALTIDRSKIVLHGDENDVASFLHRCMQKVLKEYYNTSTEKQKQERTGIYYDSTQQKFIRFPKVKTQGIASIIFPKAPRPLKDQAKLDKKTGEITDVKYNYLTSKLKAFLEQENLKIDAANLLIDGPNAIQPKYEIDLDLKDQSDNCFICGSNQNKLAELKGTAFPLITGESGIKSFFSFADKAEKICWKCDYLSRFVPVNGFFKKLENEGLMTFFPYSNNLEKIYKEFIKLEVTKKPDEYYAQNFQEFLGGYFQKGFESSFSFFYTLYRKVLNVQIDDESDNLDADLLGNEFDKNLNALMEDDFFDFHFLEVTKLGDSYIGKTNWLYNDTIYLFRVLKEIEIKRNIRIKKVMNQMIDFENTKIQNKTLLRNKICERILKKKKIIDLIEPFIFTVNKSKRTYFRDVFNFTLAYENLIGGDQKMDNQAREVAVKLGQQIGGTAASDPKNTRRGKGDLFKLRKSRTIPDFLEEINRLQFRYNINITKNIYEGVITKENFKEFKQYVMIAALNTYNGKLSYKQTTND